MPQILLLELPGVPSSMFAPRDIATLEVRDILKKRYGPFVKDNQEMERLLQLLADSNLRTYNSPLVRYLLWISFGVAF